MDMDPEASPGPARCDSSLSVIKITPATRKKKGVLPVVTQKFSDPEIEELYQLHSTNRKRTELFRCFLYALLFYCVAQVVLNSFWLSHRNSDRYGDPHPLPNKGVKGQVRGPIHVSILKPHDVTHELDKTRLNPGTGDQPHQHHPTSLHHEAARQVHLNANPAPTPGDSPGTHPAQNPKHFPPKQNPSFMSHQQHPALGQGGTRPSKPSQVHPPADHPFFHFSSLNTTTGRAKRATASKLFAKGIDNVYNHRTDDGDKIFMVTSFVFLGVTMVVTLFMLISPGTCRGNAHIPVLLWSSNILVSIVLRSEESSLPLRLGLGWLLLEIFLIWVTLPIRFRTALLYSSFLTAIHSGVVLWRGKRQPLLGPQLGANLILLVTTNVLGILSFYLSDKKQRRAFLDTRQSLEMKLVIEEQAKEQERLLLSVLPEHLALKMRQDLGEATDGQFKKIYMARHENVSILYADIVGFTAISSTYSASELVKILNELFARFDRLSDKYSQIRIKILGDCYYCICGAPEERKDHAVLSVHMGLSMVKAIKYVRETTNSPVDMRVGIHTGAILAGVLGQRQWQFDVYSKDVELANKMESSGMPGRVHISDKTLSFLTDEFEVEPAYGERREEMLRTAGLKTYFITRVLKPFHENSSSKMISENGEVQEDTIVKDFPSDLNSTFAEDSTSAVEENGTGRKDSELESYRLRLKEELISRDGYRDLAKQSKWFTLQFLDGRKEAQFVIYKEPYAGISSLACPIALVAFSLATFFVISFNLIALTTAILALIILLSISVISAYETCPIKSRLKKTSNSLGFLCSLDSKLWVRRLLGTLTILLLTTVNAIFTIPCMEAGSQCSNMTTDQLIEHSTMEPMAPMVLPNIARTFSSLGCRFPAYLILFCSFFLFSVTLLAQPLSWLKSFFIFLVLLAHALLINLEPLQSAFECSERFSFSGADLIPENWQLTIFIIVIFFVLFTLNRRLEKSSRVLFLWKTEVEQQREHATQLRQKNEALVYNILPQHVASHFLGNRKRKHEELYSQSYSEVGILFASMPNFSDFYSEESVNNQGLECLRFLNEVISDFDGILELPRFADHIIKIKTISSTYMAASGLNPSKQTRPEDPLKQRWAHLSLLVEFALEMKIILTGINEQSFNHFVLKMGINHGPITAGVIGARKPHYDIWGNSVNVASRMESTGKAGCIQVTEETYRILKAFGYQFEQRGLVNVKGKGQLMTYYLTGRGPELSNQEVDDLLDQYAKEALQTSAPLEVNQAAPNNKK